MPRFVLLLILAMPVFVCANDKTPSLCSESVAVVPKKVMAYSQLEASVKEDDRRQRELGFLRLLRTREQQAQENRGCMDVITCEKWVAFQKKKVEEAKKKLEEAERQRLEPGDDSPFASEDQVNERAGGVQSAQRELERAEKVAAEIKEWQGMPAGPLRDKKEFELWEKEFARKTLRLEGNPGYHTCGLSAAELQAMIFLSEGGLKDVNAALRDKANGKPAAYQKMKDFDVVLRSALNKLAPFTGIFFRPALLAGESEKRYQKGQPPILEPTYFVGSREAARDKSHLFVIQSTNCRWIAPLSLRYSEQEVICLPGTQFEITGRQARDKVTEIMMTEKEAAPVLAPLEPL